MKNNPLVKFITIFFSIMLFFSTQAHAGCDIKVVITNNGASTAHITRLGVKVKAGTWRNIQEHGKRILSQGQTYTEIFKPTIQSGCDNRRRYRFKVVCKNSSGAIGLSSAVSKNWIYHPSERGWTRNDNIEINTNCP